MRKFLPLFAPVTVQDYPYGFNKRTTMTYHIEYKKNKGFRLGSTTVNPTTGKTNATKYSTYDSFRRLYIDKESGFVKCGSFNPLSTEEYNRALASGIFEGITKEEYDHEKKMAICLFTSIRWMVSFRGFSINGAEIVNPRQLPILSDEDGDILKSLDYSKILTLYSRIEKEYESFNK